MTKSKSRRQSTPKVSLSETYTEICPDCGAKVRTRLWLIVDTLENPDLVEDIRQQRLNTVRCLRCKHEFLSESPVMVHDPTRERVLFAVPHGPPTPIDHAMASELLETMVLAHSRSRRIHTSQAYVVTRAALASLVDADELPESAEPIAPSKGMQTGQDVIRALRRLSEATTLAEAQETVREHPELLDETLLQALDGFVAMSSDDKPDGDRQMVIAAQRWIKRCCQAQPDGGDAQDDGESDEPERQLPADLVQPFAAAIASTEQQRVTDTTKALKVTCRAWRRVCEHPSFPDAAQAVRAKALYNAGTLSLLLHGRSSRAVDLEYGVSCLEAMLGHEPAGDDRVAALSMLGSAYMTRFAGEDDSAALDRAIDCYAQVVSGAPSVLPGGRLGALEDLFDALQERFRRERSGEDLDQMIGILHEIGDAVKHDADETEDG